MADASRTFILTGGKLNSTSNQFEIAYYHVADGDTSNRMEFGRHGVTGIITMQFDSKVGINKLTPAYTLDVAGDISLSGSLRNGGTVIIDGSINATFNKMYAGATNASYTTGTAQAGESPAKILTTTFTNTSSAGTDGTHRTSLYLPFPTYTSTNAITTTNASTLYIAGGPVGAGNMSISNGWGIYCGGPSYFLSITTPNALTATGTTDASSTTTGTIIVSGGVGIAKKLYIGDNLNVASSKTITIGGTSMAETDMSRIVGITNGTALANKALVLDGSTNISSINSLSCAFLKPSTGIVVGNTADSGFQVSCLDSTIGSSSRRFIYGGGKALSTNNRFELAYFHVSDGNSSNRFEIGCYGTTGLVAVQFDGKVGMGTTSPICRLHLGATLSNQTLCAYGTGTAGTDLFYGWGTNDGYLKHQANTGHAIYVGSKGNSVGTEMVRITSVGMVIGPTADPLYPLEVELDTGSATGADAFFTYTVGTGVTTGTSFDPVTVSIYAKGRVVCTELDALSDKRIKQNITTLTDDYCDRLLNIEPRMYKKLPTNDIEVGFIAQDVIKEGMTEMVGVVKDLAKKELLVEEVDEYGVISHEDVMYTLNYNGFIPMLLNLVKRNRKKNEELQSQIDELKNIVRQLI